MSHTNWKDIPGPGDALPPETSDREEVRERAVEILAEIELDELMKDEASRGEAMTTLTDDEYAAINAAYDEGPMAYWQATKTALRRALKAQARAEAERIVAVMEREDEADRLAEQEQD